MGVHDNLALLWKETAEVREDYKGSSRRRDKNADKTCRLTGKYYDSGLIFSLRTPSHLHNFSVGHDVSGTAHKERGRNREGDGGDTVASSVL